jgi:hypothetical protein
MPKKANPCIERISDICPWTKSTFDPSSSLAAVAAQRFRGDLLQSAWTTRA